MNKEFIEELRKMEFNMDNIGDLFSIYFLTCGILTIEDVKKIINHHKIDISIDDVYDIILDSGFLFINDKYFALDVSFNENILDYRKDLSIRLFDIKELTDYSLLFFNILNELKKIIKDEEKSSQILFYEMSIRLFINDNKKQLDIVLKNLGINKSKYNEIKDIFENHYGEIRYWFLYGRTLLESNFDSVVDDMLMLEKPDSDDILSCVNKLSQNGLDNIINSYDTSDKDKISKLIIDSFKDEIQFFSIQDYDLYLNTKVLNYHFSEEDILNGYYFVYEEKGRRMVIVPKEIKDLIKKLDKESLTDEDTFDDGKYDFLMDEFNEDYELSLIISGYIIMNGIIEKCVLKDLLLERHNFDLSISEMDEIVLSLDLLINGNYYTVEIDDEEVKDLIKFKKCYKDYKTYDSSIVDIDTKFLDEMNKFTEDNFKNKSDEVMMIIVETVKYGVFNKEMIDNLGDEINLSKKEKNMIMDAVKPYKNIVPVWVLNGYCLDDKVVKDEKKIGRNDPCPCGSGKKYKKCCGR